MELTIALSISPESSKNDITETLESLPWDTNGVDLVIYSEDTKRVKKIIKEEDLESTLLNGQMNVLFCEEPYSSDDTYMNIGVEDCKTELITFLKPGDTIEFFDPDLLEETKEVGFGNIEGGYPVTSTCYESRMLPLSTSGMIFSADFLRRNFLKIDDTFIPRLINIMVAELESPMYNDSWGKYSIDEMYSVSPKNQTPLDKEYNLPEIYVDLWSKHEISYNDYLRDLVWNRIMRASGLIVSTYPDKKSVVSKFYKYLLPDNKVSILC